MRPRVFLASHESHGDAGCLAYDSWNLEREQLYFRVIYSMMEKSDFG
jgi:hypothetical protein